MMSVHMELAASLLCRDKRPSGAPRSSESPTTGVAPYSPTANRRVLPPALAAAADREATPMVVAQARSTADPRETAAAPAPGIGVLPGDTLPSSAVALGVSTIPRGLEPQPGQPTTRHTQPCMSTMQVPRVEQANSGRTPHYATVSRTWVPEGAQAVPPLVAASTQPLCAEPPSRRRGAGGTAYRRPQSQWRSRPGLQHQRGGVCGTPPPLQH